MLETISALLVAHMVADFLLQTRWIIENKRGWIGFGLHVCIVAGTAVLALGGFTLNAQLWMAIALVVLSHAGLDAFKTFALPPKKLQESADLDVWAFVLDQLGHLGVIVLAGICFPMAFAQGEWAWRLGEHGALFTQICLVVAGLIAATRMGGFLIEKFLARFPMPVLEVKAAPEPGQGAQTPPDPGLKEGGVWIGLLERAVIFCLILIGQFTAIGFLLAAKSVLRFQYAHERSQSEYVIIGTLTSFSWAAGIGLLTQWGLGLVGTH